MLHALDQWTVLVRVCPAYPLSPLRLHEKMGQAIQFFNEVEEGCGDPHYTGATKVAGHNLKIGPATDMKAHVYR